MLKLKCYLFIALVNELNKKKKHSFSRPLVGGCYKLSFTCKGHDIIYERGNHLRAIVRQIEVTDPTTTSSFGYSSHRENYIFVFYTTELTQKRMNVVLYVFPSNYNLIFVILYLKCVKISKGVTNSCNTKDR